MKRKLKPKINTYAVIMRAVEEGIAYGLNRADKHADDPITLQQRQRIEHQLDISISTALSEVINFD